MGWKHDGYAAGPGAGTLDHRLDGDPMVAQRRRDVREDAWLVEHRKAYVIAADMALHRDGRMPGQLGNRHAEGRRPAPASDVDEEIGRASGRERGCQYV